MRSITWCVPLVAVFMVGCQGETTSSPSTDRAVSTSAQVRQVPPELASANRMLTIKPGAIDLCEHPQGVIPVFVAWDARATGTEGVEVYLQAPGEQPKLWARSGAHGGDMTGPWMRDGSRVILINGDGTELASLTINGLACQSPR